MIGTYDVLDLHRKGLRLIPCRGKVALLKDWPDLHLGESDLQHWSVKGVNWAAICGDPLVVFDTDTDEAEKYVQEHRIESPVMVRTGGGGFHRWFVTPQEVEIHSKSGMHGIKGLDLRSWRSYIMLPGSIHPDTGNRYEWVPGRELGEVHELPMFDLRWIQREKPHADASTLASKPAAAISGKIRDVRAYVRGIRAVKDQDRSKQCFTAACLLLEAGLTPDEALVELIEWNETNAFPPWPIDGSGGLRHKIRYACKRVLGVDPGVEWERRGG